MIVSLPAKLKKQYLLTKSNTIMNKIKRLLIMMFLSSVGTGAYAIDHLSAYTAVENGHEHTPAKSVTENVQPSTCEGNGSYDDVVYCSECGEELSRTTFQTDPLGHDYGDWVESSSPTCTEDGSRTRTCCRDQSHVDVEYIPALGHNYAAVVTPPTCTEAGYTTYTCTRCDDSYVGDMTDPLGHNWGEVVYQWSEDNNQVTATRTCERDASHVDSETVQTTKVETKAPTDTESGEVTYTATFSKPGFTVQPKVETTPSWNELREEYNYGDLLGYYYSPEYTYFRMWNPLASKVTLKYYATGTDAEANAELLDTVEMERFMFDGRWTGAWTATVSGNLGGSYYTYVVDGVEMPDPWAMAESSDGNRSMVCDYSLTIPEGWDKDVFVFHEQGNIVKSIDATTTSDILNGMAALKQSGFNTVAIKITCPQLVPDLISSDPNDGAKVITEMRQAIQTIHKEYGMSVFINFDFSTVPVIPSLRSEYIIMSCITWAWEYHADGIMLVSDIDEETKAYIRNILNSYDTRIVFGTEEEIMAYQNVGIEGIASTTSDGAWYTLTGVKLQGEPTEKGIYVRDGRKVVHGQ